MTTYRADFSKGRSKTMNSKREFEAGWLVTISGGRDTQGRPFDEPMTLMGFARTREMAHKATDREAAYFLKHSRPGSYITEREIVRAKRT